MKKILFIFTFAILFGSTGAFAAPVSNLFRSVVPETDNTYYLGTTSPSNLRYKSIFLGTGTSTSANGFDISGGCFAISGTCLGGSSGSGTVGSGTQGQFPFYNAAGTTLTATSTLFVSQAGLVGVNNASPTAGLHVIGKPATTAFRVKADPSSGPDAIIVERSDSTATVFSVNGTGIAFMNLLGVGEAEDSTYQARIVSGTPGRPILRLKHTSSPTSDYFQVVTDVGGSIFNVDSGGDVGVATSSPWAKLSVTNTGTNPSFVVEDTASPDSTPFIVDASGNVGIGSTTPATTLSVNGDIYGNSGIGAGVVETNDGRITANSAFNSTKAASSTILMSQGTTILRARGGDAQTGTYPIPNNIGIGSGSGASFNGNGYLNVAIGYNAMQVATSAATNVAIGPSALQNMISGAGNVGIGNGALQNNTIGNNNLAIGQQALQNSSGSSNTAIGNATLTNTSGTDNVALGANAGRLISTGTNNLCIGSSACYSNITDTTTGAYNVSIGDRAGSNGIANIAIGSNAYYNGTASNNIAIGGSALNGSGGVVSGGRNVAIGSSVLSRLTTGTNNTGIGDSAMVFNITGSENVAIGYNSLRYNQSATGTVAIGAYTGYGGSSESVFDAQDNTFIGYYAGYSSRTSGNTMIGGYSGTSVSTGQKNLTLGYKAGENITTGSNNIIIGYDINATSSTAVGSLNIGNLLYGIGLDGINDTVSTGNIGIASSTPYAKLSVTNTGTQPSFVVEDSTSPDSSPFIIDASGNVGIGTTTPSTKLEINNSLAFTSEHNQTSASNAVTVDWTTGNYQQINTLTEDTTITMVAPNNKKAVGQLQLRFVMDGVGGYTVTWPATVKWPGGTAPTLTMFAGTSDIFGFWFDGTNYYNNYTMMDVR